MKYSKHFAKRVSNLRSAIATMNGKMVEAEELGLDHKLVFDE